MMKLTCCTASYLCQTFILHVTRPLQAGFKDETNQYTTNLTQFAKAQNNPANQYFQYKALYKKRKLSVLIVMITGL